MKVLSFLSLLAVAMMSTMSVASAHTPVFACYDNGDGTVLCEGGFSDGSSASGTSILVKNAADQLVLEGKLNEDSEVEFKKPDGKYSVSLDAGEGHQIVISSDDIVE